MAGEEKPYRVYKSGRGQGKLPRLPRLGKGSGPQDRPPRGSRLPRQPKSTRRKVFQVLAILLCLFVAWLAACILASYFSFRDAVDAANARLPLSATHALTHQG